MDWSTPSRPWPKPGFFSDEFGPRLLVERRLADLPIPPDLGPPQRGRPQITVSPVERVINLAPTRINKINSRDDPARPGRFELGDPRDQWPDPEQVYRKLVDYCLRVGHPQGKWKGFAEIGYVARREEDPRFLSYALCSALVRGAFTPFDIKVSADGTLEFAVNIVIPCRNGTFRNVCTAWNAKAGQALAISTAYVTPPNAYPCALILQPPADIAQSRNWSQVYNWAIAQSDRYARHIPTSASRAGGWLWLPHADRTSREFAAWYRKSAGPHIGTFYRAALGGRCTQVLSPFGIMGVTRTVASLRMLQYCLGVAGIRSLVEMRDD